MSEPTLIERLRYQSKVTDLRNIERQGAMYLAELAGGAADRIAELEEDEKEASKSYRMQVKRGDDWQKLNKELETRDTSFQIGAALAKKEIAALQSARKWQPIETAPKDDSVIDLWHKAGFRMIECWWVDEDNCWSCSLGDTSFTHWMILPKPPAQENKNGN